MAAPPRGPTFVVMGAGAMGRIVVKDLVETAPDRTTVIVGDFSGTAARAVARSHRSPARRVTVKAARVDARDARTTARLLRETGTFGVINATQHAFNLHVMQAALAARVHYCDLGGLFHQTRRQLTLHRAWKDADRLALLGIGAAPGIVNVLARSSADLMDEVHEIHVYVAGAVPGAADAKQSPSDAARDVARAHQLSPEAPPLNVSYSIQTVLEEASLDAAVFTDGTLTFVPPLSGAMDVTFPKPVGRKRPALTIHSEVATLPLTYRKRGIRECSFRIAFPDELVDKLTFLRAIGMLSDRPRSAGGKTSVTPRDFLLSVLKSQPPTPPASGALEEYEILRVVVRGVRGGNRIEEIVECHTPGMPEWSIGSDINTGSPPSIAMQMLAAGQIAARGCLPPERALPPEPFFRELERRRMTIRRTAGPYV